MKIMLIVDDYVPASIKIAAKMMHELALQFIIDGHEVTVLTPSNSNKHSGEHEIINNLTVYEFDSGKIKNTSKIKRALNESLLSFNAYFSLYSKLKSDKHDLIIYYSPTIFFGPLVSILKRKWNCKTYLILRDFFPQWAIDQKILKKSSMITKYFQFFEKINYKAADFIALQSPNNLEWFDKNIKIKKPLKILYNWTNAFEEKQEHSKSNKYRSKLNLENKVVFFYGGNMGQAQDMMNLVRLARNMLSYSNAHFIFVGIGDEVDLVKDSIRKYSLINSMYLGSVNQSEYKEMLSEFDIGLFSLHSLHSTHNFPGKLLGYMANEMPILGSINKGNDLKIIVEQANAGLITINGEDQKLMNNAEILLKNSEKRKKLGVNAKTLLRNKFSVKKITQQIIIDIQDH